MRRGREVEGRDVREVLWFGKGLLWLDYSESSVERSGWVLHVRFDKGSKLLSIDTLPTG